MPRVTLVLIACALVLACRPGEVTSTGGVVDTALAPSNLSAFFDCLRKSGRTIVAAHRGGPAPGFPELAIATFENTLRQAPALLEIDISRSKDNVLVLMHDDTVDRTTTGSGEVRALTFAQLQALRLEDPDRRVVDMRIPTLREALDWAAGRTVLELDVKVGVPYEAVLAEVRAAAALDRVVVITYNDAAVVRLHKLEPRLMISASIDAVTDLDALAARGVDLTRVLAWTGIEAPDRALNSALAARGVEAMFGTLGSPAQSWDGRFAREGREGYANLAATGLTLISSDRPIEAARDLDAQDGAEGNAVLQCVVAR
jgi:glycerophosphoryl diester phosphodiesterase